MFCFPSVRRRRRPADPAEPGDRGLFPEDSPEELAVVCRYRRPGSGWAWLGSQDRMRRSRGTGIPAEAGDGPGSAQADGKERECRRDPAQQEKPKVATSPGGMRALGKDTGEQPRVPCPARNGNVPREGAERPQLPAEEDEEGEPGGCDRDTATATTPGGDGDGDGDGQDAEPGRAAEPRAQLMEKLRRLGEDTERWEGKATAELAAGLARRIAGTPPGRYPAGPAARTGEHRGSSAAGRDPGAPRGVYGSLLAMLRAGGSAPNAEEGSGSGSGSDSDLGSESDSDSDGEQAAVSVFVLRTRVSLEEEFPAVWARSRVDCGKLPEEEALHGDPVPFQRQRPQPPDKERQMEELLQEYLRAGIVVEGTSDSNSSLVLVERRHGRGHCLSLDCAALNAATPVPPPERPERLAILASVHPRSRFFSVLDLSNSCLAIPLAPSCWGRFAFTFGGRQFLFTRLPPTFHGTGSILHRRVAAVLARLEPGAAPGVSHYYDDILITGKSRRQAEYRTRRVLELIQSSGFKANRDKAQLVRRRVRYLGLTLGAAGRRVPTEKVREICGDCDAPGPWSPARLRSVLGKFNDLKYFIPDYLELAQLLQSLAVPGKWEWERKWEREWEREREQLQQLKEALKAAPTLLFPDKSRPFVIRLSVHATTVGAALLQEKAGILRPVGHCSRKLGGQDWAPQDTPCLAAVRAVQAFQSLTGPAPVVIQAAAGRYLLRGEPLLAAGSRLPDQWTLLVTTEGPEPQESQVLAIPLAPELWQLPPDIPEANVWFLAVEKGWSPEPCVGFAAASLKGRWLLGVSRGGDEEEAALEALGELLEQHRSRCPLFLYCSVAGLAARLELRRWQGWSGGGGDAWPGVLRWLRAFPGMLRVREVRPGGERAPWDPWWMGKASARAREEAAGGGGSGWKRWEPSADERQEMVAQCHRGHEGVEGTLSRVLQVASWKGVRKDVARWVRRCPTCRDRDPGPDPDLDPDPDPAPQREWGPWSRLRIGLCAGLPVSPEGFRALLVVQDALSGWADAVPLRQRSEPEVTRALLREVFGRFGSVSAVLLEPQPRWMWDSLARPPLLQFRGRVERSEPLAVSAALRRVAQAVGAGWAGMLPLILAGIAAQWVREEQLGPLLCVPGLPLEWRWECPGQEPGNNGNNGNELSRLRGMRLLPGHRERVKEALG